MGVVDGGAEPGDESVADEIRRAVASGDDAETLRLLSTRTLEAWFNLPGPEFFAVLHGLPEEAHESNFFVAILIQMTQAPSNALEASSGEIEQSSEPASLKFADLVSSPEAREYSQQFAWSETIVESLMCRARGHIRRASDLSKNYKRVGGFASLFDASGGLESFIAVQAGITQMLAGEFPSAIARLTSAKILPTSSGLSFLHRDAYVKTALIHALFGDQYVANALLQRAEGVERTASWAESGIDVCVTLTQLALKRGVPTRRDLSVLDTIPMYDLGEMWPFYVLTLHRLYSAAGLDDEVLTRLLLLEQAEFPRRNGDGLPGSVFAMCIAASAALTGQIALAESRMQEADQTMPVTQVTVALVALRDGRPADALRILDELRPHTQSLRQTEIWRGSLEVAALLALGDDEQAASVVRNMQEQMGAFGEDEILVREPKLRTFFAKQLHQLASEQAADSEADRPILTSRESEVLALLAENVKRDDIAMLLFVSVNTVKSHQRTLFKKLGVTNRAAAVSEAGRLGLIKPFRTA